MVTPFLSPWFKGSAWFREANFSGDLGLRGKQIVCCSLELGPRDYLLWKPGEHASFELEVGGSVCIGSAIWNSWHCLSQLFLSILFCSEF